MRIAYVINSLEGGGAALPVPAVTRLLRDHGAEVEVLALTRRDGRSLAALQASGLPVRLRDGGERDHFAAFSWLHRNIATGQFDLIWTSLTRATLIGQRVGARRRVPVVSWQHNAFLKPANLALLRASRKLSALWVADSHSVAALTATRLRLPPARLATWPLFAADILAPQARAWRSGETLQLGALGRLHRAKGFDVLVAALTLMRTAGFTSPVPFQVTLAGEGERRGELEAALKAAGHANVRLAGFEPRPRAFLAGLHLYLQPSRAEGLCIAAHEAMQAGLPAVVSAVGEMPYSVVDGLTGVVVPPADPQALAKALTALLSQPDRLGEMGERARARVLDLFGGQAFSRAGAAVVARLPVELRGTKA